MKGGLNNMDKVVKFEKELNNQKVIFDIIINEHTCEEEYVTIKFEDVIEERVPIEYRIIKGSIIKCFKLYSMRMYNKIKEYCTTLKKDEPIFLTVDDQTIKNIKRAKEELKQEIFQKFRNNEISITVSAREGEYLGYYYTVDTIPILLDNLNKILGFNFINQALPQRVINNDSKIIPYVNKELFYKDLVELYKEEIKKANEKNQNKKQKRIKEIEEILSKSDEQLASILFIDKVHVTEDGYFSDCPPYCDDCFFYDYVVNPYYKDVKDIATTFIVKSKKGKTYTYYSPNLKVLSLLATKYKDTIDDYRNKLKIEKQVLEKELL